MDTHSRKDVYDVLFIVKEGRKESNRKRKSLIQNRRNLSSNKLEDDLLQLFSLTCASDLLLLLPHEHQLLITKRFQFPTPVLLYTRMLRHCPVPIIL